MATDRLLPPCACIDVLPCQAQDVLAEPKPRKHAGDFPLFVLKYLRKRHGMKSMVQQVSSITHFTALQRFACAIGHVLVAGSVAAACKATMCLYSRLC
jgi:hypothetical protein